MKGKFTLYSLMWLFIVTVSFAACNKAEHESPTSVLELNDAEKWVQENPDNWNGIVSEEFIQEYVCSQDLFNENVLRECLTPGQPIDTSFEARTKRMSLLHSNLYGRDISGQTVESIIQVSSVKRILDANAESVVLVISNMGSTAQPYMSYDYLQNSMNKITPADLFLANWALNNTQTNGNFIVSDDDYIELIDGTVTVSTMMSGQNYFVEAILQYNGPGTNFTHYNTITGTTETIPIQTGEILAYGPGTPLGELILDPTLYNETWDGEFLTEFVDAKLVGPIPGGSFIALQSGTIIQ